MTYFSWDKILASTLTEKFTMTSLQDRDVYKNYLLQNE